MAPLASAVRVSALALWWKHVVIHADDHRDKHDRVIKKMEFNPREEQLKYAARYRFTPKIVMDSRLPDKQKMFDMMPELYPERDHPPRIGNSREALPQHPNADQHHQGIAIMQRFCLDQPGIPQAEQAQSPRARPSHNINLVSLDKVLGPMSEHNKHKNLQ